MDLQIASGRAEEAPADTLLLPAASVEAAAPFGRPAAAAAKADESVRVPAERLDELMDRVGELVIAQSRACRSSHNAAAKTWACVRCRRTSSGSPGELRDTMMVLRMVPVATLFGRFRRLVHDLARKPASRSSWSPRANTEVDKTVIERLADPITHLLRNAIDHGLETPDTAWPPASRRRAWYAHARIRRGGEVVIDHPGRRARHRSAAGARQGRGTGPDQPRTRCCGRGSRQPDLPCRASPPPTDHRTSPAAASAWTWSSARSRRCAARSISPARPARVRTISLRIPLTLAIIDGLLVRVGSGRYVIPLSAVEECLELSLDRTCVRAAAASSRCATAWCRSCVCASCSTGHPA
jgi:two-component system chemotaxis sensor kinase CheA